MSKITKIENKIFNLSSSGVVAEISYDSDYKCEIDMYIFPDMKIISIDDYNDQLTFYALEELDNGYKINILHNKNEQKYGYCTITGEKRQINHILTFNNENLLLFHDKSISVLNKEKLELKVYEFDSHNKCHSICRLDNYDTCYIMDNMINILTIQNIAENELKINVIKSDNHKNVISVIKMFGSILCFSVPGKLVLFNYLKNKENILDTYKTKYDWQNIIKLNSRELITVSDHGTILEKITLVIKIKRKNFTDVLFNFAE